MLAAGARKLVDYLDPAYALEYLDRVGMLSDLDRARGGEAKGFAFTVAAAKYLAIAMAYDDVPRVADLKIRASRQARVRREVQAPRRTRSSRRPNISIRASRSFAARCRRRWANGSKRGRAWCRSCAASSITADAFAPNTVTGYLMLAVRRASRGPQRRATLRHARESAHREAWLKTATDGARGALRTRRRGAGLPAPGQGLFGHARARPVEVRPRDVGRARACCSARTAPTGSTG